MLDQEEAEGDEDDDDDALFGDDEGDEVNGREDVNEATNRRFGLEAQSLSLSKVAHDSDDSDSLASLASSDTMRVEAGPSTSPKSTMAQPKVR